MLKCCCIIHYVVKIKLWTNGIESKVHLKTVKNEPKKLTQKMKNQLHCCSFSQGERNITKALMKYKCNLKNLFRYTAILPQKEDLLRASNPYCDIWHVFQRFYNQFFIVIFQFFYLFCGITVSVIYKVVFKLLLVNTVDLTIPTIGTLKEHSHTWCVNCCWKRHFETFFALWLWACELLLWW